MQDDIRPAAKSTEDPTEVEKRVEEMMEPEPKEPVDPKPAEPGSTVSPDEAEELPPLDIFEDQKTAPVIPDESDAETSTEPVAAPPTETPATEGLATDQQPTTEASLDDDKSDAAVDNIAEQDGDQLLEVDDAAAAGSTVVATDNWLKRLMKRWWFWVIVAVVVLTAIFGVPFTRYKVLGLALKQDVVVTVRDSKTHTGVSKASVSVGGEAVKTDATGTVKLRVAVGTRTLTVTKQYYKDGSVSTLVPLRGVRKVNVSLDATGRQVPVVVINKITGKPVAGAEISVVATSAKTDAHGKATVVLPTGKDELEATLTNSGYNQTKAKLKVTSDVVAENTVELTPAGKLFFLSNQSGKIDVVKTNLDGTDRQTVLPGTGHENAETTSLTASKDWRYVVLQSQRDTAGAKLYLIDTTTAKLTPVDVTDADYNLVGWSGDTFVYTLTRNDVQQWQANKQELKSFDAQTKKSTTLDQSKASGDATSYSYQSFDNYFIRDSDVVYSSVWYSYSSTGASVDLSGKTDTIHTVQADGQNGKDYKSYAATQAGFVRGVRKAPDDIYFGVYGYGSGNYSFYELGNGIFKSANLTEAALYRNYPTYFASPGITKTLWSEQRDGKSTVLVGDANGSNETEISSATRYTPFGWYTDNYLLVSKGGNELYILPTDGSKPPLKVSDYFSASALQGGYGN